MGQVVSGNSSANAAAVLDCRCTVCQMSGMELRVGNKYRLGRKIGSGSFGDIYLGNLDLCQLKALMFNILFL